MHIYLIYFRIIWNKLMSVEEGENRIIPKKKQKYHQIEVGGIEISPWFLKEWWAEGRESCGRVDGF